MLFVHGLGSSKEGYRHRAVAVAEATGVVALAFDLSGHGSSSDYELYTPNDHVADVLAARSFLVGLPEVASDRIGISGASYGAYLSVLATGKASFERLLLRAPAVYADHDRSLPLAHRSRIYPIDQAADLFVTLENFGGDVMILQSEHDELVPPPVVKAYVDACGKAEFGVIRGASHALTEHAWDEEFTDYLIRWFDDL